VRRARRMMG